MEAGDAVRADVVGAELVLVDETTPEDSKVWGNRLRGSRTSARKAEGVMATEREISLSAEC